VADRLLCLIAPHFVAGIEVLGSWRAPILSYMRNWNEDKIRRYCAQKGWLVRVVDPDADEKFLARREIDALGDTE